MAVRITMMQLIARVRTLINDPAGPSQIFDDQTIQDVMDEARIDYQNEPLQPVITYTGGTIQFLNYFHALGGWEYGYSLKQYLSIPVTPSSAEPIVGLWTFSTSTLPPVFISGSLHDVYRAAADLLERLSARYMLSYNVNVDGQSLQRGQIIQNIMTLIKNYRMKQRPTTISLVRTDTQASSIGRKGLGPSNLDYMASGDGR